MSKLYNNIIILCEKEGINTSELCRRCGVSRSSIAYLKNGQRQTLSSDALVKISKYFDVSVDFLLGKSPSPREDGKVMIPVYGKIAAGVPCDMVVDIDDFEEITAEMARKGEHFGLTIHGDSMEPEFREKDVLIIRKQEDCEDGDICAVAVNGDYATCKRVKKLPEGILLVPINPAYEPLFFSNKQIASLPVTILGKVVQSRRNYD